MPPTKRFFFFLIFCSLFACVGSCGSKKDFIITDAYVDKERGGPSSGEKTSELGKEDKAYFALKLGVAPSELTNAKLYGFVKRCEGKRISTGGAGLVTLLYDSVYNRKITGTPTDIMSDKRLELFKSQDNLREGDLVFFRTSSDEVVTHTGVYLKNGRFVSSENNKAAIYSLDKKKWKSNFVSGGRFKS
ncbi:NlpC/P60 family protein [Flavobacterium sp.]|uniref:NlpC/P60 family protein n=1 Tax=Flavobacterium sp. TaxID=239 RepID=UPI00121DD7E4|nr:NlpC/P60 family protein [Flavobacterium sp.]RZJ70715.1 MAG: hypothetical protein EOO49_12750 [Flavobacterium sp.]